MKDKEQKPEEVVRFAQCPNCAHIWIVEDIDVRSGAATSEPDPEFVGRHFLTDEELAKQRVATSERKDLFEYGDGMLGGDSGVTGELEVMSEQLHIWYLEGTRELDPANYNPKAQKYYAELNEQQKEIDRYIAKKVLAALKVKDGYSIGYQTAKAEYSAHIKLLVEAMKEGSEVLRAHGFFLTADKIDAVLAKTKPI